MTILQTIDDIDWTPQSVFNHVYVHLIEQGARCQESGFCSYRGKDYESGDELACAAGAVIPADLYEDWMQHTGPIVSLIERLRHSDDPRRLDLAFRLDQNLSLLTDLQRVHDHLPVELWAEGLGRVATSHDLQVPMN